VRGEMETRSLRARSRASGGGLVGMCWGGLAAVRDMSQMYL
jgi:dienelactone hydrolase